MAALDFWTDPARNPFAPPSFAGTTTQTQTQAAGDAPVVSGTLQRGSQQDIEDMMRDLFTGRNRSILAGGFDSNMFDIGQRYDPAKVNALAKWLESMGWSAQRDSAGNIRGRVYDPQGRAFDLMDPAGMWAFISRGLLSGGGGGSGGGGLFSVPRGTNRFGEPQLIAGGGQSFEDAPAVFSDPATVEWEKLLRQFADRLVTPYSDPDELAAEDYYRKYFQRLQGPAYTPQEMDLLNTQQIDPLTADRDANRQRVLLWAQSHGMTPESGPVLQMLQDADRSYEALNTRARADIATKAIDLGRENEARAMQVGSVLAALKEHMFDKNEGRFGQAVDTMKQIPLYADTRLQLAMAALGMGGGGAVNGLSNALGLMGQFENSKSGGGTDSDASFWANLLNAGVGAIPFFGSMRR